MRCGGARRVGIINYCFRISAPLESTYQAMWQVLPEPMKKLLEG
jgi:hypothetical protein